MYIQKIIEIDSQNFILELENCPLKEANLFRRILASQIRAIAIHKVTFRHNTSHLSNEFLSQRLGLLKLVFQDQFKNNFQVQLNENCPSDSLTRKIIRGRDLTCPDFCQVHDEDLDAEICSLYPGQRLCFVATVTEGAQLNQTNKKLKYNQAKFNPVSHCGFISDSSKLFLSIDGRKNKDQIIQEALEIYSSKK